MVLKRVNDALYRAAQSLGYDGGQESYISFSEHGDCSSHIAFLLAKSLKRTPQDLAEEICGKLSSEKYIKSAERAKGGFINIFLTEESLAEETDEIISDENYGKLKPNGIRANLEFLSANPTGPLVLVNARAAIIGSALAEIMKYCGYDAQTETYINNCGSQIENLGKSVIYSAMEKPDFDFPENGYRGAYIKDIALMFAGENKHFDSGPESVKKASDFAAEYILKWQRESLDRFKIKFDSWVFESSIRDKGKVESVMEKFREKVLVYESEGAVFLRTTDYFDDKDRVIYKSNGEMTYLLPDIAYHSDKIDRGFGYIIDILGPDHHGYIGRIKSAVSALDEKIKFDIIIAQIVTLFKDGQKYEMSKRTGEFITMDEIASEIDSDVMKFLILTRKISQPFNFDIDKAKEESMDNPVYYVQYAHARICSIFAKAETAGNFQPKKINTLSDPALRPLCAKLLEYPYSVYSSFTNFEIQKLPAYLYELAGLFHRFYHDNRVLTDNVKETEEKLFVLDAVRTVIARGLLMMGIKPKERMEKDEL